MHLRSLAPVLLLLLAVQGVPLWAAEEATSPAEGDLLAPYRDMLAAQSAGLRLEGLRQLLAARPEGAAALLEEFLWHDDERFRRSVLDALVMMGDTEALTVLDRALADEDPALRATAVRAITDWPGEASLQRLRAASKDEENQVIAAAVEGLTRRNAVGHGDQLIPLLDRDDEGVLAATILALRAAGNRKALPALARVAERSRPQVAILATDTIAQMGGAEAVSALIHLSGPGLGPELRRAAMRGLGKNPSKRVTEHLLRVAGPPVTGEKQEPSPLRREAVAALASQGELLRPHGAQVAALLEDPDADLRRAVLRLIRVVPLPEAAGPTRALAGDESRDPEERTLALRVLVVFDAETAGRLAATIAAESDQMNARIQAVQILASLAEDAGPRKALLELLADPDPSISALALESLRGRLQAEDVAVVAQAAASQDVGMRLTVCDLLGETGSPEAVPTLATLIADPEPAVRQAAAAGLGSLGGDAARQALSEHRMDPDAGVRSTVREALARLDPGI